jgi:hypothetical protein
MRRGDATPCSRGGRMKIEDVVDQVETRFDELAEHAEFCGEN